MFNRAGAGPFSIPKVVKTLEGSKLTEGRKLLYFIYMAGLVFSSCMAHADWLLRGPEKNALQGAVRGQYAFFRTSVVWRENF